MSLYIIFPQICTKYWCHRSVCSPALQTEVSLPPPPSKISLPQLHLPIPLGPTEGECFEVCHLGLQEESLVRQNRSNGEKRGVCATRLGDLEVQQSLYSGCVECRLGFFRPWLWILLRSLLDGFMGFFIFFKIALHSVVLFNL